ncbi:MAG: ArsC/Spx/MgsR family protein [Alistipes ihumii]
MEAESRDIVLSNGRDELSQWIATSGCRHANSSTRADSAGTESERKVAKASDGELIALLATEGKLVKRPLLVGPDFVLVGFREEQWQEKLLGR